MHDFDDTRPVTIAYLGGGSLNWAMKLMADLAFDTRLAATVRLFDIDRSAARRNADIGSRYADVSRGVPATFEVSETLGDALQDADIVLISILPGSFEDMAYDVNIPASFGVPQAVGDTVGPGGFIRALRSIPMMAEFAKAIKEVAPDAYVCNLTNPMSALTGALFSVFPEIKAWGECHEVTKMRKQVAWIANQECGDDNTHSFRDVSVNVLGINHFTFVDRITLDGRNMMPAYQTFAAAHRTKGWGQSEANESDEHRQYFGTRNLVAFDLLSRFGIPAAAGDRHLAEFFPVAEYLSDPAAWGFALTPVEFRQRDRAEKQARAEKTRTGDFPVTARRSDEAMIDQIVALMGGGEFTSNANLPNRGQLDGVPLGAIVETNATFNQAGIVPQPAGQLPDGLEVIVNGHANRQSQMVKAVLHGDRDAIFPLFRADPLLAAIKDGDAREIFDRMVAATASLIPETLRGTV
ncbi:family 4 glycosyl hydrolase [Pacificibacter marinus]|uniref:Alpha-galacturonidase n=1 Tax=Pacificibacter marinus TaxID=658057 RepID=A0A1Y5SIF4_9RHOB|nr:alpha-galactosidase [Pacificibacter marinus]SEK61568.1 alpha-galactosidase [Pacificibacter marinus]SLN41570.1 Alpha-galacturonidase [Pacificibacter marinus]